MAKINGKDFKGHGWLKVKSFHKDRPFTKDRPLIKTKRK